MKATYTIKFENGTTEKYERSIRIAPSMADLTDRARVVVEKVLGADYRLNATDLEPIATVKEDYTVANAGRPRYHHVDLFVSEAEKERLNAEATRQGLYYNHQYATRQYLEQLETAAHEMRRCAEELERIHLLVQTSVILPDDKHGSRYDNGLLPSDINPLRFAAEAVDIVTRAPGNSRVHYLVQYSAQLAQAATLNEEHIASQS